MVDKMKLYNADCLPAMKEMPDNAYDLAIVDPPYGIGVFRNRPWKGRPYNKDWKIDWNDSPPTAEYFSELYRVSTEVICWGANYYGGFIKETGRIIWDKGNNSGIGSACEIASQPKDLRIVKFTYQNTGFCRADSDIKIHPCQKPVALYKWLLTNYAKPGQTILDTHLGSGSSAIACHDYGYDLTAYEIDKEYFEAATERIERHKAQGQLFQAGEVMTAESIKGRVGN